MREWGTGARICCALGLGRGMDRQRGEGTACLMLLGVRELGVPVLKQRMPVLVCVHSTGSLLTQCSCCFWCIGLSSAAELGGYQGVGISFCNVFPQEYKLLFEGAGSNPGDKTLEDRFFEHEVSEP